MEFFEPCAFVSVQPEDRGQMEFDCFGGGIDQQPEPIPVYAIRVDQRDGDPVDI
jgi:hypothetical protein